MKNAHTSLSRRNLLSLSGLAVGAWVIDRAGIAAPAPSIPTAPVSVAKVASYDLDLVAELERMFDEIGGIGHLVRGKTVAMKLNMTGASGRGRRVGISAGRTTWVHPSVVGALVTVLGKLGAKRIRLLESTTRRKDGAPLEDALLQDGWDVNAIKNAAPLVELEDTNGLGQGKQYSILKVKTEHPYIFPEVAEADEVNGAVVEPDLERVHLPEGLLFSVEGVINHLDSMAFHSCLVHLVQDVPELGVVLVGLDPHVEYRLHLVEVAQGLGREGGLDLFEDGIDGVVEWRPFEDPHQVFVEVKGHELGEGERRGDLELISVNEGPPVGLVNLFSVERKAGGLEGFQVAVDTP